MTDAQGVETFDAGWTGPILTERCRHLADSLRRAGVPDAELEPMAPGGARNPTTDPYFGAVVWFASLRARWEFLQLERSREAQRAESSIAAALAGAPHKVTLSPDGAPGAVYPKSYHALRFCDALDDALRGIVATAAQLETVDVRASAPLAESLAVRLWAWILTHPAPDLPFDEGQPVDPPAWTLQLTPEDLLTLLEAHVEVNRARIVRITQLFPSEGGGESRLTLAGFLGTAAQELKQRPAELLRGWTTGEVFAQAVVAAQSSREARERSEQDARERRTA